MEGKSSPEPVRVTRSDGVPNIFCDQARVRTPIEGPVPEGAPALARRAFEAMKDFFGRAPCRIGCMASLNRRRALDPRWPWHQRSAAIGHMSVEVEIFRRPGQGNDYGFDPVSGMLTIPDGQGGVKFPELILLYRGRARVANNKDWRARLRTSRGDMGTLHALRVQVPIRTCPPIHANDLIRAVDSPADPELCHYILHVRNPLMSSGSWVRNLLCDVDVAHPQTLPPPYTMDPVVTQNGVTGP